MTAPLTPAEASAWFEAALEVLAVDEDDRDRFAWVLDAQRYLYTPHIRRRGIHELQEAADHNRRFNTPESRRDARILCFCATILRALEVKR